MIEEFYNLTKIHKMHPSLKSNMIYSINRHLYKSERIFLYYLNIST